MEKLCEGEEPSTPGGSDPNTPTINYGGGGDPVSGGPTTNPEDLPVPGEVEEAQNELGGVITLPNLGLNPKNTTPCEKAKIPLMHANSLRNNINVKSKLDALGNNASNVAAEYAVTISQDPNNSAYTATDPYTDSNSGQVNITPPASGNYKANGHSHPCTGALPPSVADFYSDLKNTLNYSTFEIGYVFSCGGTEYAIVVNDRQAAIDFLAAYPAADNLTPNRQLFNDDFPIGKDFNHIYKNYMEGRLPSYSGSSQNDALESALAYISENYNAGMSIAKKDANGNLKALKSVSFQYTIPASGGKIITGYKAEMCP